MYQLEDWVFFLEKLHFFHILRNLMKIYEREKILGPFRISLENSKANQANLHLEGEKKKSALGQISK